MKRNKKVRCITAAMLAAMVLVTGSSAMLVQAAESPAAVTAIAESAEVIDSGSCGETVTWSLDSTNWLTISGTGDMTEYDDPYGMP